MKLNIIHLFQHVVHPDKALHGTWVSFGVQQPFYVMTWIRHYTAVQETHFMFCSFFFITSQFYQIDMMITEIMFTVKTDLHFKNLWQCYATHNPALKTKLRCTCLCLLSWLWHKSCEMRAVKQECLTSPCHRLEGWGLFRFAFMSVLSSLPYEVKRITQAGFWLLWLFDSAQNVRIF